MLSMLDQIKRYLRITGSEEDALLASLTLAAKQYLTNAGVPAPDKDTPEGEAELYTLAATLYVSLMHEGVENKALNAAMTSIILQIKDHGGDTA